MLAKNNQYLYVQPQTILLPQHAGQNGQQILLLQDQNQFRQPQQQQYQIIQVNHTKIFIIQSLIYLSATQWSANCTSNPTTAANYS